MAHCTVATDTHSTDNNRPTYYTTDVPVDRHVIQPIHQWTDMSFNRRTVQPIYQSTVMSFNRHNSRPIYLSTDRYTSQPTCHLTDTIQPDPSVDWYIGCTVCRLNDMSVDCCQLNDMSAVWLCRLNGYRSPQCNGLFNRTIYSPVSEEEWGR